MYYQSIPAAALLWKQNICADITGAYMRRCWNERSWINNCTSSSCWEGPQKTIFTLWPDPTSYGKSMQISILFPPQHPFFFMAPCAKFWNIMKHPVSYPAPSSSNYCMFFQVLFSLLHGGIINHKRKSRDEPEGMEVFKASTWCYVATCGS